MPGVYNSGDVLKRAEWLNDEILAAGSNGQWDRVSQLKNESATLHREFPGVFSEIAKGQVALARAGKVQLMDPRDERVSADYPSRMGRALGIPIESNDDPAYPEYWQRKFNARADVGILQAARVRGQLGEVKNIPDDAKQELLSASDALINAKVFPTDLAMKTMSTVAPLVNSHLYAATGDDATDKAALASRAPARYAATAQLLRMTRDPDELDAVMTTIAPYVPKDPKGGSINQLMSVVKYADSLRTKYPGVNIYHEAKLAIDDSTAKKILAKYDGDPMRLVDYAAERAAVGLKPEMNSTVQMLGNKSYMPLVSDAAALLNIAKAEVDQKYVGKSERTDALIVARGLVEKAQRNIDAARSVQNPGAKEQALMLTGVIDRTRAMQMANPMLGAKLDAQGNVLGPRADEFDLWAAASADPSLTGADIRTYYEAAQASLNHNKNLALSSATQGKPPPAAWLMPARTADGVVTASEYVRNLRDGKVPLPEPNPAVLVQAGVSSVDEMYDAFAPGVSENERTATSQELAKRARFANAVGKWEANRAAMAQSIDDVDAGAMRDKLNSSEYMSIVEQLGNAVTSPFIDSSDKYAAREIVLKNGSSLALPQLMPYAKYKEFRQRNGIDASIGYQAALVTGSVLNIGALQLAAEGTKGIARVARPFVGAEKALNIEAMGKYGKLFIDQEMGGPENAFVVVEGNVLSPRYDAPAPIAEINGKLVSWDTEDPVQKHAMGLYLTPASPKFIEASVKAQARLRSDIKKSTQSKEVLQSHPKKDQINGLFMTFPSAQDAERVVPPKKQSAYLMRHRMLRQAEVPLLDFLRVHGDPDAADEYA